MSGFIRSSFILDESQEGLAEAFTKYRAVCPDILRKRGVKNIEMSIFNEWLERRFNESDKPLFLHEDPRYRVASYFGEGGP